MKDNVSYKEFLAAVYEAENEGTDFCKVVTMKAKAMTVEKGIEEREKSELKDLKQQIESLTMIMKSTTVGPGKAKVREGISSPKKELLGNSPQKRMQGSPKKGKIFLRPGQKPLQCFRCEGLGHGWHECLTVENFNWREMMGAGVLLTSRNPGSAPTQTQSQSQCFIKY